MIELQTSEIATITSWIYKYSSTPVLNNERDPPHAHIDEFVKNWHQLGDKSIIQILTKIVCPGNLRRAVLICEIAEGELRLPPPPSSYQEVFFLSHRLNSPPAIYLPSRTANLSPHGPERCRLERLDVGIIAARMSCSKWVESDRVKFDCTVDFMQSV